MFMITSAIVTLIGSSAVLGPAVAEPNPKIMSQADIRAFNAQLDKTHKYFIRCKRGAATGSFVKREVSCRTNEQWTLADAHGNQEAREIGEEMQSKSWNTGN